MGLAKCGGCLLERVGLTKLSELTIDTDKDWLTFGITNIAEVAAGMQKGDLPFFDGAGIAILVPGSIGTMLTTQGLAAFPIWSY